MAAHSSSDHLVPTEALMFLTPILVGWEMRACVSLGLLQSGNPQVKGESPEVTKKEKRIV